MDEFCEELQGKLLAIVNGLLEIIREELKKDEAALGDPRVVANCIDEMAMNMLSFATHYTIHYPSACLSNEILDGLALREIRGRLEGMGIKTNAVEDN